MTLLKGKITSAKHQGNMVWMHISGMGAGSGWIALNRNIFDNVFKKRLTNQIYKKHNREIKRDIKKLKHQIKILKKEDDKKHAIERKKHEIVSLNGKIKKELHMDDLKNRKIYFMIK